MNVGRGAREGGNPVREKIPQVASTLVQLEVATPSPDGRRHIAQRTAWGKANEGHRGERESGWQEERRQGRRAVTGTTTKAEVKGTATRAESL